MFTALQPQVSTHKVSTPNSELETKYAQSALTYSIADEFEELNCRQEELISCIEDKLHNIIDKRVPKDDSKKEVSNGQNDFRGIIASRLTRMKSNTNRLEQALNHLQEIA